MNWITWLFRGPKKTIPVPPGNGRADKRRQLMDHRKRAKRTKPVTFWCPIGGHEHVMVGEPALENLVRPCTLCVGPIVEAVHA